MDNETLEFISDVNYVLYKNNNLVFQNKTSNDSITVLPSRIDFDSILLSKLNYNSISIKSKNLTEVVYMTKSVLELDEIVITDKKNESDIILGEKSRFVKKASRIISNKTDFGIIFNLKRNKTNVIKKISFYVDKTKYKTDYVIKLYSVEEIGEVLRFQTLRINELLFESPINTIEKSTKNKIEVDLSNYKLKPNSNTIFVSIELRNYYDKDNNVITPEIKNQTKLKFQLSEKQNYYSKTVDKNSRDLSKNLININLLINYDFATQFFREPHKSILVSPAILLNINQQ